VLAYTYTLLEGYKYKFADAAFAANKNAYFNISEYDYALVNIKASKGTRIQLGFSSFIDQYTKVTDGISFRISLFNLNVQPVFQAIKIPLSALYTPDWWYTENNKKESDFGPPNLAKIQEITFSNCINIKNNVADQVEIRAFSFHIDYTKPLLYSAIACIVYFILGRIFLFRKPPTNQTGVNFIYDHSEENTYLNEEEKNVFEFITTYYYKQDLSIIDLQEATAIPERKLSIMIKNKTGLNFKQFLNHLRLVEAKRLLKESDFQVAEIAFKVGYSNASHFNRVFKSSENCSPNDYRKDPSSQNA
jgi:AraC-like DNA-binding protein